MRRFQMCLCVLGCVYVWNDSPLLDTVTDFEYRLSTCHTWLVCHICSLETCNWGLGGQQHAEENECTFGVTEVTDEGVLLPFVMVWVLVVIPRWISSAEPWRTYWNISLGGFPRLSVAFYISSKCSCFGEYDSRRAAEEIMIRQMVGSHVTTRCVKWGWLLQTGVLPLSIRNDKIPPRSEDANNISRCLASYIQIQQH